MADNGLDIIPTVLNSVVSAAVGGAGALLFTWLFTRSKLKPHIPLGGEPRRDRGRLTFEVTIENPSKQENVINGLAFTTEHGEDGPLREDSEIEKGEGIRGHGTLSGKVSVTLPSKPGRYGYLVIRPARGRAVRFKVPIPPQPT